MRRLVLLPVILLVVTAGTAQAAPRFPIVTGAYSYEYLSHVSTVNIVGRAGDPAGGSFSYSGEFATFGGPVSCVRVVGADAWLSGPITRGDPGIEGVDGWAIRLHDAGAPGWKGDMAITFLDTTDAARALCQSATSEYDDYLQPVTAGNLVVHQAR
jgi:hypothetical protein